MLIVSNSTWTGLSQKHKLKKKKFKLYVNTALNIFFKKSALKYDWGTDLHI